MEWKDIVEWVKKILPAKLRVPFTAGVMLLGLLCLLTIFAQGYEWTEVFWEWWIQLAAAGVCLYWAVSVLVFRKSIVWRRSVSWALSGVLILGMAVLSLFSYGRSLYRFEKNGFFVSRAWQPDKKAGPGYFEWKMEPTSDVSKSTVNIAMLVGDRCDLSQIEGPAPVKEEFLTHHPIITDDSTMEHPNTLWRVKDLHRGEEVTFRLFLKGERKSVESICITPVVNSN
jgi:hypothetical protein